MKTEPTGQCGAQVQTPRNNFRDVLLGAPLRPPSFKVSLHGLIKHHVIGQMERFAARVVLASSVGDGDVLHARVMLEPLADWESAGLKAITATATNLLRVCQSLVETACKTLWVTPRSALSELRSNKPVVYLGLKSQSGCRVALKQGSLTEISGETGAGKTQFCMIWPHGLLRTTPG